MDARHTIMEELHGVEGPKKTAGNSLMIQCPFHNDGTPSCGVNVAVDTGIPLGYFNCLGCSEKGPWNKLAKKLGLTQFKDWELGYEGESFDSIRKKKVEDFGDNKLIAAMRSKEMIPWPKKMNWRGYEGDIIRKLGGLLYNDKVSDELLLFFPIEVGGTFVGGVRALMEKPKKGPSYINTDGKWVSQSGLLGYQYLKKVMKKRAYTALVLVEGPRDVVRLLLNKIPALAILGIENFSEKKLMKILNINGKIDTIYVLPDNDKAGLRMYTTIKNIAEGYCTVKHLRLPRRMDEEGKLIKMDPDDADIDIIIKIKNMINKKHLIR